MNNPRPDSVIPYTASSYDRGVRMTLPYYDLFHRETLDLVRAVRPSVRLWLDTGCGTGSLVKEALGLFPKTVFLLADPAAEMLKAAEGKVAKLGKGRVKFMLPIDSAGLSAWKGKVRPEVVTAIQCHHYLRPEGRYRAVKAIRDLLAPKGLFVVFENIAPDSREGVQIGLKRWASFQAALGKSPSEAAKHVKRYGEEFFPITVEAHLKLLRKAGFKTVELFWRSQLQAGFYAIK